MTSGSTGSPKAILRTNGNFLAETGAFQHEQITPLTEGDIELTFNFSHSCGSLVSCIDTGALLAIVRADEAHSDTFEAIHKYGITKALLVPTQLNFLLKNDHKYDKTYLTSLKDLYTGGAYLSESTYHSIVSKYQFDKFRNCKFY